LSLHDNGLKKEALRLESFEYILVSLSGRKLNVFEKSNFFR